MLVKIEIPVIEAILILLVIIIVPMLLTTFGTSIYWYLAQRHRIYRLTRQHQEEFGQAINRFTKQQQVASRELIRRFRHEANDYFVPMKAGLSLVRDEIQEILAPTNQKRHLALDKALDDVEYFDWRLTQLIENLNMISQLEMPDHALSFSQVKLDTIVDNAIIELRPVAEAKGVQLSWWAIPEDFPRITANGESLHWVFTNLVDNAIKYCHEHDEVDISLEANTNKRVVYAIVQDTGPGIPEDDLDRIFEKGYTVEGPRDRRAKGQGLGLYIVKLIAEKHGGHVSAESQVGHGTTFTITLPIQRL